LFRRVKDSPPPKSFSSGERVKLAAMFRCRLEALRTKERGVGIELTTPFASARLWVRVNIRPEASLNSKLTGSLLTLTDPNGPS
jgi:hypothetical protein